MLRLQALSSFIASVSGLCTPVQALSTLPENGVRALLLAISATTDACGTILPLLQQLRMTILWS